MGNKNDIQIQELDPGELARRYIIVLSLFLFYFFTTETQSQKLFQQLIGDGENDMGDENNIQIQKFNPGELTTGSEYKYLFYSYSYFTFLPPKHSPRSFFSNLYAIVRITWETKIISRFKNSIQES